MLAAAPLAPTCSTSKVGKDAVNRVLDLAEVQRAALLLLSRLVKLLEQFDAGQRAAAALDRRGRRGSDGVLGRLVVYLGLWWRVGPENR